MFVSVVEASPKPVRDAAQHWGASAGWGLSGAGACRREGRGFVAFGPTDLLRKYPRACVAATGASGPVREPTSRRRRGRSPAAHRHAADRQARPGRQPARSSPGELASGPCHSNVPLMSQSYSAYVTVMSRQCHSRGVCGHRAAHGQHAAVVSDRPRRALLGAQTAPMRRSLWAGLAAWARPAPVRPT